MTLLMVPAHAGFMVYLIVLPMLLWLPYSIYIIYRFPERRRLQWQKVTIWLGMIAIVIGTHVIRHEATRHNADSIATAIKNYSASHGHCPAKLEGIGLDPQQLRSKLGLSGYSCKDGEPLLFYAATFIVFDTYHYDFKNNTWQYFSD